MLNRVFKCVLVLFICMVCLTCKKKPDEIKIVLYDPLMDKPIANAELCLGEVKEKLTKNLAPGNPCERITTTTTDINGQAILKGAKLRTNSRYHYFVAVTNFYGLKSIGLCGDFGTTLKKTNGSIDLKIYCYSRDQDWGISLNNLNSGGFGNHDEDSIYVRLDRDFGLFNDFNNSSLNGNKKFAGELYLTKNIYKRLNNPVNPESYKVSYYLNKLHPGKYRITVYKKKDGIVTEKALTEYMTPQANYFFNISW